MHPDILQRDGPKLKYPEWNAFVKEKAGDIEKIDGRGKVKVNIFRSFLVYIYFGQNCTHFF